MCVRHQLMGFAATAEAAADLSKDAAEEERQQFLPLRLRHRLLEDVGRGTLVLVQRLVRFRLQLLQLVHHQLPLALR